ncbi:MAG TPA: GNAT family N-acetyltransferase, partial [Candidatus Limnocylindrales bacterium]|nr:GNAT family N-acetyltransferase [Candidatus Limnocylindrales bacterium]
RPDELIPMCRAVDVTFGGAGLRDEEIASARERLGDRFYVASDEGIVVGGGADFPFQLTVPGGELPAAGVTWVGVLPTHRRRGLLTRIMGVALDAIASRGEPLAILWASESGIYQRFGYGLATLNGAVELSRARSAFRDAVEPAGRVRLIERAEADQLLPPLFDRLRPARPGFWARSAAWWKEILDDPEQSRRGAGRKFFALHEVDGQPDGYATYRIQGDWDLTGPRCTLRLLELMADGPLPTRELWHYLCGVDLVGTIQARFGPVEHPLLDLLADPRALRLVEGDGVWLRFLDVGAALQGRRYGALDRIVLEVGDSFRPDQAGRYLLDASTAVPRVTRTDEPPDLALDTSDLGAAYLGRQALGRLAAVGRVRALQPGAVERADALFRTAVAPYSPAEF